MIQWIIDAVLYVINLITQAGSFLAEALMDQMPTDSAPALTNVIAYIKAANYWVPLDFGLGLLSNYLLLLGAWNVYKFSKSWLPGLGAT